MPIGAYLEFLDWTRIDPPIGGFDAPSLGAAAPLGAAD
jgi:hypothetical protein